MDEMVPPPALQVERLSHAYGPVTALDGIELAVGRGELLTIVGPSGSGKTSLLRILAGFETPNRGGRLRIGGKDMLDLPPDRRPVATVFQHYALFPHLSVGENVEYGLRVRGVPRPQRRARAAEALEIMRLPGREARRIGQLSGGERQRVAFARALVTDSDILLLDEPMGALDEPLRRALEAEIRGLQRTLGTTVIQVTHGREEALAMSDRLVVLKAGRVEQDATPRTVFERPVSRFVAGFMGLTNQMTGRIVSAGNGQVSIETASGCFDGQWSGAAPARPGTHGFLAVHPEKLRLDPDGACSNQLEGRVLQAFYQGLGSRIELETEFGLFIAISDCNEPFGGTINRFGWTAGDCVIGDLDAT